MIKPDWDTIANAYAANILAKHLQALQVEIDGVHLNQDPEFVHRMRVASRRLRNALGIFSFCIPEKELHRWLKSFKKITCSLGKARDKDVQIIFVQSILDKIEDPKLAPGLKRVILRLKQKRAGFQGQVTQSLNELIATNDLLEMQMQLISMGQTGSGETQSSLALYRLAWEIILQQLQEFLSYEIFINDSANINELHAMRIAAKKLRYSIEAFSALYPDELKPYLTAVRQTQDTLGSMHDSFVWNQYLTKFMKKEKQRAVDFYGSARGMSALQPGITFLSQHQVDNYQDQYKTFINDWHSWQADNLWQELVNVIKAPLF